MRVLGVDPGYGRLGVAVVEKINGRETVLYSSCVETDSQVPLFERHSILGKELESLIKKYAPDRLGIETLFFNRNVSTALGVAEARGIALYLARAANCHIIEFSPQQVKVAVTGYGQSDKKAVISMVKRLASGVPQKAHDDEYDAIAIGIATLAHRT